MSPRPTYSIFVLCAAVLHCVTTTYCKHCCSLKLPPDLHYFSNIKKGQLKSISSKIKCHDKGEIKPAVFCHPVSAW